MADRLQRSDPQSHGWFWPPWRRFRPVPGGAGECLEADSDWVCHRVRHPHTLTSTMRRRSPPRATGISSIYAFLYLHRQAEGFIGW